MSDLSLPRGTKDFNPSEAISLNETISVVEEIFKRFGFYPISTPAIENLDILNTKAYGDESAKEIYTIQEEESGLRYDLTVPLARYVAMNKDIPIPFKRYQIDRVWRRDEPQHLRSREFIQADIDIVGSKEVSADAEVIAGAALALEALGMNNYKIFINNRITLNAILDMFEIPKEKHVAVIRIIDKMNKISRDEMASAMDKAGVNSAKTTKLLNFITEEMENDEKLAKLASEIDSIKPEMARFDNLLELLDSYKLSGEVVVDFSLARGLDYYTSFVWEFIAFEDGKRLPSIGSGGRYDNLIGLYSKVSQPAVGSSLGISRIAELQEDNSITKTYAKVFVAYIGKDNLAYALSIANVLRQSGIYTDMNLIDRSISKQLEYVNTVKIKFTIILGNLEKTAKKVKLRDMINGEEELLTIEDAVKKIKG